MVVELPEVGADRAVFLQIRPVGRDAHAAHRLPVDDVEQMVLPRRRRARSPDPRPSAGPAGPEIEPPADLARNLSRARRALRTGPARLHVPGGQQQGGDMLAVEAHRAGAHPLDRAQRPAGPERGDGRDRIRVQHAARHPAADPAGRLEFDRPHHAALEIVQPPREERLADRVPEVAPIEQGLPLRRMRAAYPDAPAQAAGRRPLTRLPAGCAARRGFSRCAAIQNHAAYASPAALLGPMPPSAGSSSCRRPCN